MVQISVKQTAGVLYKFKVVVYFLQIGAAPAHETELQN